MSLVVHIGFGAFHKAHQAAYLQTLFNEGHGDWKIQAINLRGADADQFAVEASKPFYELTTFDEEGRESSQVIDRHTEFFDWSVDAQATQNVLANPEVCVATITISEAGYFFDKNAKLDTKHPEIQAEKAGKAQTTIYAFLTAALQARHDAGAGPINILCCDNLRDNGKLLHRNFAAYLAHTGRHDLATWVETNCAFPCSMVDRITPAPTAVASPDSSHGTTVIAETFVQWVIQDWFVAPRPPLEKAGVNVVDTVTPYEEAKIRVLNGGHTALCYLGALSGHETFDQAMEDPELRDHFLRFEKVEVMRAMPANMPVDLGTYISLIEGRFTNKAIGDSIARICTDGFAKFGIFIRPTLEGCFAAGQIPAFTIRSIAAWFHYARLNALGKRSDAYKEPNWDVLKPLLDREDPTEFLNHSTLFGDVAKKHPEFTQEFERQLSYLEQKWPA